MFGCLFGRLLALGGLGVDADLQAAEESLAGLKREAGARFLAARVKRVRDLNRQAERLLGNPLVKWFAKLG